LATALFDRPAFSTCLAHGIVLGNEGQKMSKAREELSWTPGRSSAVMVE
jgi:isoleucyl-tRNA synthetase